jgi:hypothetical protein
MKLGKDDEGRVADQVSRLPGAEPPPERREHQ